ncbi:hypothetical protein Tco_0221079 [Tanacetum coccineum]
MTTPSNNRQMPNDIMAVGSREGPPMLALVGVLRRNSTLEKRRVIDVEAEAEAIHMILNGIGDEIYSTVDVCATAREMWLSIERLQQEESINKQDAKMKMINEMVKNKLKIDTMQGFGHFAKEYRKPQRAKDYAYHKENMMLCKQEEKGVSLSVEQDEWLHDTYEELDEQELEAHYIQHSEQPESINDTYVVEMVDGNVILDSSYMCDNEGTTYQNVEEPKDERVLLASLIANIKLSVDENKKSQKQLKNANTSLTQELEKSKQDLEKRKQYLEISKQDLS